MFQRTISTIAIILYAMGAGALIVNEPPYHVPENKPPLAAAPLPSLIEDYAAVMGEDLSAYTYYTAQALGVAPKLVYNIIESESGFNPGAVNGQYVGLMQVSTANLPYIEQCFGREFDLTDPYDNILAGTFWYSGIQANNNGSVDKNLMVYNYGGDVARQMWERGITSTPYSQTITSTL